MCNSSPSGSTQTPAEFSWARDFYMLHAKPSAFSLLNLLSFLGYFRSWLKVSLFICHGQMHYIWCKRQEKQGPSSKVWIDSHPQLPFSKGDKEYWFEQQTLSEQLSAPSWAQRTQLGCSCCYHSRAGGSNLHKEGATPSEGPTTQIWATTTAKVGPLWLESILGKCTFLECSARICFLKT